MTKVCSEEQFNSILAILINSNKEEENISLPEKLKNAMMQVSILSNEDLSNAFKARAISILKNYFNIRTEEASEYIENSKDCFVHIHQPIKYEQAENLKELLKKYNIDVAIGINV